jgi:acetylxylan esterase
MQHRNRNHIFALTSLFGLFVAAPAGAASLQKVSDWGASGVPSYVQMYIYVPDKLAAKPPILVSAHSCGSTATGQMGNIPKIKAAADANGFILILPDNPGQNCWDVGSTKSLTHDGGGDTQAVAQMVKYALGKYSGDASRVYAMGGSSGAMLTQALMAVYPDVFVAGSARAGVPAGCWADGYTSSNQWSNNCAGGNTTKTAQEWGDLVRAMDPGYSGHRPRLQIIQGDADQTISFKNSAEAIKEWTNVLALSTAPTSTDTITTSVATYSRQFWKNACGYTVLEAWAGHGGGHSMAYEEDAILAFLGLDKAGGPDPELAACAGGASGAGGAGGASSAGGASGSGGSTSGNGGAAGFAATAGAGGSAPSGAGGTPSNAGAPGLAGNSAGGLPGAAGAAGAASSSGGSAAGGMPSSGSVAGSPSGGDASSEGSCSIVGGNKTRGAVPTMTALLLALGLASRRRRRR